MALPVVSELQAFLSAARLLDLPVTGPYAQLDYQGELDAAYEELQDRVGCWPFLAASPPGLEQRVVEFAGLMPGQPARVGLGSGILGLPTSVRLNGLALVGGTTWQVWPRDAPYRGRPYTHPVVPLADRSTE